MGSPCLEFATKVQILALVQLFPDNADNNRSKATPPISCANLIGTGDTCAVGALSNSPERGFNLSNQSSALASLLEQGLLCEAADGLVVGVLWRVDV